MQVFKHQTEMSDWLMGVKKYFYLVQTLGFFLPFVVFALVAYTHNGNWLWLILFIFYIVSAVFDLVAGEDTINPLADDEPQLKHTVFYDRLLEFMVLGYTINFLFVCWLVANIELTVVQFIVAVIATGAMFSGAFVVGHELGHRRNHARQFLLSRLVLSLFGYGHFQIEHNRGHHVKVATPEDAASARMGENVYEFMVREISQTLPRAFALEEQRLSRMGFSFWSVQNQLLQNYVFTFALYALLCVLLGWVVLPFLLCALVVGYFQLTVTNYLEHYGLLRQKLPNGRYEKCQPEHSWNSNYFFTNMLTLQLQRHSDHHANATRPYQILRDYDNVPQLPAGYPFMQLLAVIPPVWRQVMDKRLLHFVGYDMDKVNVSPAKRDRLYARYHHVGAV